MAAVSACHLARVLLLLVLLEAGLVHCAPPAQAFRRTAGKVPWHHGQFQSVRAGVKEATHSLLHHATEAPLHVPLEINVVLVGFGGEDGGRRYKLDAEEFRWFLQRSFPSRRPACLETGLELNVEHDLTYIVLPVGGEELGEIERSVRGQMRPAGTRKNAGGDSTMALYDVEAGGVEPALDALYLWLFGQNATAASEKDLERPAPSALFILNLDKARLDPSKEPPAAGAQLLEDELASRAAGFEYRYTYGGGGYTQAWLSHGRYAAVDLSAGPCTYGQLAAHEGAVGPWTLPRLGGLSRAAGATPGGAAGQAPAESQAVVQGHLSAVVVSAVEHLFSPDVRFETLDIAHRVLLPVIVLRNHHQYDVLHAGGGGRHAIDLKALEAEVRKMLQPGQELVVVGGTHSLHDHQRIAMALTKATRSRTVAEAGPDGRPVAVTRAFIDGSYLVEELRHSADMLAAGLLDAGTPDLSKSFFNPLLPGHEGGAAAKGSKPSGLIHKRPVRHHTTLLPVKRDWQPREGGGKARQRRLRRERAEKAMSKVAHGTRVVPVFVLSLAGVPGDLLMDDESALHVSHDAVVVLQTSNDSVPLSFVSEGARRLAAPSEPQRSVTAGVAAVLGGLSAPYEGVAARDRRGRQDWLWAAGHHPFGPFSNSSTLSLLLRDTMLRNAIYSRVDAALHGIRECLMAIESFSDQYMRTPFGDLIAEPAARTAGGMWLDELYHDPKKKVQPLPHPIVKQLEDSLEELEDRLVQLSAQLYDHSLVDSHGLSSSLLEFSHTFYEYVHVELASAKDGMRCCRVEHRRPMYSGLALVYAAILVAGFLIYFLVIFLSTPER